MQTLTLLQPAFPALINRRVARWTAFQISVLSLLAVFNVLPEVIAVVLFADFLIRNLVGPRPSLFVQVSRRLFALTAERFGVTEELASIRPTRFAWFCGLIFTAVAVVAVFTKQTLLFTGALSVLALFSGLEALFGFCVACYLFGWAQRFGWIGPDVCVDCTR